MSISISRLLLNVSFIEPWAVISLFLAFLVIFALYVKSDWIGERAWTHKMTKKFQAPVIGILNEVQCENNRDGHPYTSFLSSDWDAQLKRQDLNTKIIAIDQLDDEYAVVINPYGEVYPERDPLSLHSFEKIKKYIDKGGIFVCAGGVPFYYCWDSRTEHRVTLSKQVQGYVMRAQNILLPTFFYPPVFSLVDIPVNESFGVNVLGDIQPPPSAAPGWQPIFPTHPSNQDMQYVGNITLVGGSNQAFLFRSVTPVTRSCIPFLRAIVPNIGEVYPMAGIPYGRGLLVVCGMNLDSGASAGGFNIDRVEFEKICAAIRNILDGITRNVVSYDWRRD